MNHSIIAFIIALAVAYITTPSVIKLAGRVGAIDIPKDERRVHKVPTPRLGGIAIFSGFLVALVYTIWANNIILDKETLVKMIGIVVGASIMIVTGFVDDIKPISAKKKFLIQTLAAIIVIYCGIKVEVLTNPIYFITKQVPYINLGWWAYPITLVWIVGVTNAINLIDGLDGLAAGVSTISSLTLFAVAIFTKQPTIAVLALALTGATLGFLPYNFNPAKIFMGDSGSLFLGYMLAVISVMGVFKSAAALSILVPVFAIGIPIFDTFFAMIRRVLNGKSITEADKGHLHHRLMDAGLSQKQAVLALYFVSAVLGFSAVALVEATIKVAITLVCLIFVLATLGLKYLGVANTKASDIENKLQN